MEQLLKELNKNVYILFLNNIQVLVCFKTPVRLRGCRPGPPRESLPGAGPAGRLGVHGTCEASLQGAPLFSSFRALLAGRLLPFRGGAGGQAVHGLLQDVLALAGGQVAEVVLGRQLHKPVLRNSVIGGRERACPSPSPPAESMGCHVTWAPPGLSPLWGGPGCCFYGTNPLACLGPLALQC